MQIKPIRTEDDYKSALARVREIWDAEDGTPESDELDVLALLIEAYGNEHYPIVPPDPIDEIEYRLQETGMAPEHVEIMINRINELRPNANVLILANQPVTSAKPKKLKNKRAPKPNQNIVTA
ncbi:MAG: hypothetical protein WC647_07730 [Desulfomonilaceae bacterium]|jgi:HTH-type transcriptional regulator/antitoxin HigA